MHKHLNQTAVKNITQVQNERTSGGWTVSFSRSCTAMACFVPVQGSTWSHPWMLIELEAVYFPQWIDVQLYQFSDPSDCMLEQEGR